MDNDTNAPKQADGQAGSGPGKRAGARAGRKPGQKADQKAGRKAGRKGNRANRANREVSGAETGAEAGRDSTQRALVPVADRVPEKAPERLPEKRPQNRPGQRPDSAAPPLASRARMKRRHWGLLFSFFLLVLAPLAAIIFYFWTIAVDQYASTTGFTVRQEESGGASELLGGLAGFTSGNAASDGDILYEFIQSQEMVETVDAVVDLRAHYSAHWPDDWAFSIWPDASLEALIWYWERVVRVSYEPSNGLIELRVLAFDAEMAQRIAREIQRVSEARINALNAQAREDAMGYAQADLDESIARLKAAREALTRFRTRTQIVDPAADIQARLGVMTNLQQQLAEALIEYDLLHGTARDDDPRLTKAEQRIQVIRERIASERAAFASDGTEVGSLGEDYPTLIAEFESLTVDREYAEEAYRATLAALSVARADAARQSRYLATYIQPTLPHSSEYPRRYLLSALAALFLLLGWSIMALIYYSIRDRG